jgi:hypothetical protein
MGEGKEVKTWHSKSPLFIFTLCYCFCSSDAQLSVCFRKMPRLNFTRITSVPENDVTL